MEDTDNILKLSASAEKFVKDAVVETFGGIFKMPKTMKQLAFVQFFTWFALFAMWIYSTNAVTANKYNMKVDKALVDKMEVAVKMDAGKSAIGQYIF